MKEKIKNKKEERKNKKTARCLFTMRIFLLLLFSFFSFHFSFGLDFGLVLSQSAEISDNGAEDNYFEYTGSVVPRLVFPAGQNGEIFISASFTLGYDNAQEEVFYYPELMRTEYNMRKGSLGLKLGRVSYLDPLGYIASGLFDGFQLTHSSSAGRLGFGAWYSGFIFKKSAYITMTDKDKELYNVDLDYDEFADTYFGSRRAIAALEWEHPAIAEKLSLKLALLGQFDLNDLEKDELKLNSQYFILKMGLPVNSLFFEAGGSFSFMQWEAGSDSDTLMAFSFDLGVNWVLPTSFYSRLSLSGHYTSGSENEDLGPFLPISTVYAGNVFQLKRTALTAITMDYSARASKSLGLGFTAAYFVRNDLVSSEYPIIAEKEENEFLLGPEFYAKIIWSPVSDLQINLGGGVFVPALGNNWPDADMQWKVGLSAALAIF